MAGVETRHINRDSLFLMGELRLEGAERSHKVKVRNLSTAGMMAECDLHVVRGTRVTVTLRNLPPVEGSVAWVQDQRFGITFVEEIDPKAPRNSVGGGEGAPRYTRPSSISPPGARGARSSLRSI